MIDCSSRIFLAASDQLGKHWHFASTTQEEKSWGKCQLLKLGSLGALLSGLPPYLLRSGMELQQVFVPMHLHLAE